MLRRRQTAGESTTGFPAQARNDEVRQHGAKDWGSPPLILVAELAALWCASRTGRCMLRCLIVHTVARTSAVTRLSLGSARHLAPAGRVKGWVAARPSAQQYIMQRTLASFFTKGGEKKPPAASGSPAEPQGDPAQPASKGNGESRQLSRKRIVLAPVAFFRTLSCEWLRQTRI